MQNFKQILEVCLHIGCLFNGLLAFYYMQKGQFNKSAAYFGMAVWLRP